MPYYDFSCGSCNHHFEKKLPIPEYEAPTKEPCPECNQMTVTKDACAPPIGDPMRLGVTRPDAGWGEVLGKIKAAHPKGNWNNQKASPLSGR